MTRRFFIEGLTLDLPLRRDGVTGQAILDYGPVIDHPPCTPEGRPILLTIEDACRHFRPVPGTLLGVCRNEKRPAPGAQPNPDPEEERP